MGKWEQYQFLGGLEREVSVDVRFHDSVLTADERDSFLESICWELQWRAWEKYKLCGGGYDLQISTHPELATPECRTVSALVAYDEAGIRAFEKARKWVQTRMGERIDVYANGSELPTAGGSQVSSLQFWGHHENYILPDGYKREIPLWFGVLSREIVLTGTGGIDDKGRFIYSRRVESPLINLGRPGRIEIRGADATRHPFTTALRMDVVVCLLHLVSTGMKLPEPDFDPMTDSGRFTVRSLRRDSYRKVKLTNGETMSPVGYMLWLRDVMVEELGKGLPTATQQSAERFLEVMENFDRGELALVPYCEWAAKKFVLENAEVKYREDGLKGADLIDRLHAIDLKWHDSDPKRSIYMQMLKRGHLALPFSEAEYETARSLIPPNDTRAYVRSTAIRVAEKMGRHAKVGMKSVAWWNRIELADRVTALLDPWDSNVSEMRKAMPRSFEQAFQEVRAEIGPPAPRSGLQSSVGR